MGTITTALRYAPYFIKLAASELPYQRVLKAEGVHEARKYAYKVTKQHCFDILRVTGTRVIVKGAENLPREENFVYVGNHQSIFDVIVLLSNSLRPTVFVAKAELKKWPVFGRWMEHMGCIFLHREDPREAITVINEAARRVREEGMDAAIYPEGTRSRSHTIGEFQKGSFKLPQRAQCRFVPVMIDNSFAVFEADGQFHSNETVYLTFLPSVDLTKLSKEAEKSIHLDTKVKIQEAMDNITKESPQTLG